MKGKMRFWSKTKHSEKKLSREKQASRSEAADSSRGKNQLFRFSNLAFYSSLNVSLFPSQKLSLLLTVQTLRWFLPEACGTARRTKSRLPK